MNTEKTGIFIAALRKEKGITQTQLAEMIHVSDKAISCWETGRGFPDINNLEAITECLGVSVAELLKGERIKETVTKEELEEIASDGISLTEAILSRSRYVYTILGLIIGLLIVAVIVIHYKSPIYVKDAAKAVTIKELSDGSLIAELGSGVEGCDIDTVTGDDNKETVFVSCYQTKFSHIFNKSDNRELVMLGSKEEIGRIYYYPTYGEDQLIYGDDSSSNASGVRSLPRLVYGYYLIIGIILSAVGIIAYMLNRKKYYSDKLLKMALAPIALTISIPICLFGRMDEVYNAEYHLSGVILVSVVLYAFFRIAITFIRKSNTSR